MPMFAMFIGCLWFVFVVCSFFFSLTGKRKKNSCRKNLIICLSDNSRDGFPCGAIVCMQTHLEEGLPVKK